MTAIRKLKLAYERPSERVFGSREFIARSRNPDLEPPARFVPTVKGPNDVII